MYRTQTQRFARRFSRIALLAVILSLGLAAGPARPAAAAGVTVTVDPQGSGLQFHATSPLAVDWEIQVSLGTIITIPSPPHFQTGGTLPPRIHRFSSNGQVQTSFAPFFNSLLPNANYNYIVRGGGQFVTGSVRTFQNKVTVTYNRIDVIDDSDALSPGDLTFFFDVANTFDRQFGEVQAPSGLPVFPTFAQGPTSQVLFNKIGTLKVQVEGIDDDIDSPFEACRTAQPPDGTSGSDNCFDWSTASFSTSLSAIAGAGSNSGSKTVAFQTTTFRLQFKVTATITVEYAPFFTS